MSIKNAVSLVYGPTGLGNASVQKSPLQGHRSQNLLVLEVATGDHPVQPPL